MGGVPRVHRDGVRCQKGRPYTMTPGNTKSAAPSLTSQPYEFFPDKPRISNQGPQQTLAQFPVPGHGEPTSVGVKQYHMAALCVVPDISDVSHYPEESIPRNDWETGHYASTSTTSQSAFGIVSLC